MEKPRRNAIFAILGLIFTQCTPLATQSKQNYITRGNPRHRVLASTSRKVVPDICYFYPRLLRNDK